jgi:HK97 family phage major capsid protein
MKLKELLEQYEQKVAAQKSLLEKSPEALTLEDATQLKVLDTEIETLGEQVKTLQEAETLRQKAAAREALLTRPVSRLPQPAGEVVLADAKDGQVQAVFAVPSRGRAKNFKPYNGKSAEEQACRFGQWFLATCRANAKAQQWCREHGVKTIQESVNESGGFLVPDEFEQTLIDLREQYGVFRQWAKVEPMTRDTKIIPRRTGGLTTYYVGEGSTITASTKSWDQVQLVAKKLAALAKMSTEVSEDAVIDIGNDLAGEVSYAFALAEDDAGFNGDGSSTYGGITGVCPKLKGLSGTIANIAGLVVGAGNQYSELLLTDFNSVVAKLPHYADQRGRCRWFVHKTFYHSVMEKLALAAGGVTAAEIVAGAPRYRFLGYEVVISQKMPSVEANSQVCALLGDLSLACAFGDRRETTIAMSEHSDFASDLVAIRGTERYDINVHDVGNASASAGSRVPGPIVGLITMAS